MLTLLQFLATLLRFGESEEDFSGLANFIRQSRNVQVALVLIERKPNPIKVSLRSRPGFDCVNIVKRFGGGGHYAAAGCSLPGTNLQSAERIVLDAIYGEIGAVKRPLLSHQR